MKKIPIGISDFREIKLNPQLLCVDKTGLIGQGTTKILRIWLPRRCCRSDLEMLTLLKRSLFAWLIADGDMHLKNLAVL